MFRHRGLTSDEFNMQRTAATSTGSMLIAPFMPDSNTKPQPPPLPYLDKNDVNFKKTNRFSNHDNRHSFQDHGVYFGDGNASRLLGRRLTYADRRLHHTDTDFLDHRTMRPIHIHKDSLYTSSYHGDQTKEPPVHRRFPKNYQRPQTGPIALDTSTPNWHPVPEKAYRTPLHVMAVTQEPFANHNPWKYSNNALRSVYPPYETRCEPIVDNTFNRYGAAFRTGSSTTHH